MTISLELLLEFMEDLLPEYELAIPKTKSIHGPFFLDTSEYNNMTVSPDCIYLCETELLEQITTVPKSTIFFCIGPKPAKITAASVSTVFFHTSSLHHIANKYQEIVNRLTSWDREFHQKLIHNRTLEELLELTAPWIPHPIEIFDPSFHILAASRQQNGQAEGFTFSTSLGYTPPEYMSRIQQKNLLAQVQNSAAGIMKPSISGEINGKNTFNIYKCFKLDEKIVGYCTIFCGEELPSQGYLDICELFFKNMEIYFTINHKQGKTASYMYEYLLSSLMENYQSLTSRWLSDRLQYIKIRKTGVFSLIRFDFYKDTSYNGYAVSSRNTSPRYTAFFMRMRYICLWLCRKKPLFTS